LSPTRRRDLHWAAAQVLTPAAVLAHRVAATDGVDDVLARELEVSATSERAAGEATCCGLRRLVVSRRVRNGFSSRRAWAFLDAGLWPKAASLQTPIEACVAEGHQPDRVIELGDLAGAPPMLSALHFWPPLVIALIDTNQIEAAQDQVTRLSAAAVARRIDPEARVLPLKARIAAPPRRAGIDQLRTGEMLSGVGAAPFVRDWMRIFLRQVFP
jgi:hypothetical protein